MPEASGLPRIRQDLAAYGVVTQVISATSFIAAGLAGFGDGAFQSYAIYVLKKANNTTTPPHREQVACTAYTSQTGLFAHIAYTAALAVGDEILLLHPNIATAVTILAALGVPAIDSIVNLLERDVIGNKSDTANAVADNTSSLMRYAKAILAAAGPSGISQGLFYYGVVTAVPGANQFTIPTLAGLGTGKFIFATGLSWYAFVMRDAGGAAAPPQHEYQEITTYVSAAGDFTTAAFSAAVGAGDEILILHPYIWELFATYISTTTLIWPQVSKLAGAAPGVGNTVANWFAAEANIVSIGADNVRNKLHSLVLNISALVGTITIRLYQQVNGVERRVYQQAFTVAADGPGLWIVNGTVGIHEVLRVTAQSNNAADNGQGIDYDLMLEVM